MWISAARICDHHAVPYSAPVLTTRAAVISAAATKIGDTHAAARGKASTVHAAADAMNNANYTRKRRNET